MLYLLYDEYSLLFFHEDVLFLATIWEYGDFLDASLFFSIIHLHCILKRGY